METKVHDAITISITYPKHHLSNAKQWHDSHERINPMGLKTFDFDQNLGSFSKFDGLMRWASGPRQNEVDRVNLLYANEDSKSKYWIAWLSVCGLNRATFEEDNVATLPAAFN